MDITGALKNIVRIGRISTISGDQKSARVTFEDQADSVSAFLIFLRQKPEISAEIADLHTHTIKIVEWMPAVGDYVLCLFLPSSNGTDGFILGGF